MKRDVKNSKIAGVCAGLANHFGMTHSSMRIMFVIAVVLGYGFPILLYLLLWFVMEKDEPKLPER